MAKFSDLPAEVRLIIYEHIFTGRIIRYIPPQPYKTRSGKGSNDKLTRNPYHAVTGTTTSQSQAILLLSRQTYTEARCMLLKHASVDLTEFIASDWTAKLYGECASLANQIRHLQFSMGRLNWPKPSMKVIRKSLRHTPNIVSFELIDHWYAGPFWQFRLRRLISVCQSKDQLITDVLTALAADYEQRPSSGHDASYLEGIYKLLQDRGCQSGYKVRLDRNYFTMLENAVGSSALRVEAELDCASRTLLVKDTDNPGHT